MKIQEQVLLKNYSTLRVGGPARFFVEITNIPDLRMALSFVNEKNLPFYVLGDGSNVFFSDRGFSGLVLHIKIPGRHFVGSADGGVMATVGAGERWEDFVRECVERDLGGIANLSFIPGSVGASPVQNIGAYGFEVKDLISEVRAFDSISLAEHVFSNKECCFSYRDSFFKSEEGKRYIITSVVFRFQDGGNVDIRYKDLHSYFHKRKETMPITSSMVRDAVIDIRKRKLPDPEKVGTLGSFFKNPILQEDEYEKLVSRFPEIQSYQSNDGRKISAGWLIDKVCDLKGSRMGDVGVYEKQALAIVNFADSSAGDVLLFSEKVRENVRAKTGIQLEYEVQFIE